MRPPSAEMFKEKRDNHLIKVFAQGTLVLGTIYYYFKIIPFRTFWSITFWLGVAKIIYMA